MKYFEIIELYDHFQPVFDIENESGTYWKQFIPNEKFYKVLREVLSSLGGSEEHERKSIWFQGTYGTGKSHATGVIKHLLFDDFKEIEDFIDKIEDEQLKFRLKKFRQKNRRVFPIILKGTSYVRDNRTFALRIEKAAKETLKKLGIEVAIKSDFEKVLNKLQSDDINWEKIFEGTELKIYNKEDIINRLERNDITILRNLEDILSLRDIHISTNDIANWLEDLKIELQKRGIADYLMIYWDEFTGIFEIEKSGVILTELQSIAELSKNRGIFLFVVSHRKPYHTSISKDDAEKVLGRFKVLDYSMEPITTYHIINATIKKKDKRRWEELRDKYLDSLSPIVEKIAKSEDVKVVNSLRNLFPIHPYTAYLATFIARNIGSTERSIFNFLYDDEKGFKSFIKKNPDDEGKVFLTADYLWNFFYEDFERVENEKIVTVVEKFKLHKENLEEKGEEYLAVFKGILLLNILYRVAEGGEVPLIVPSEENIYRLFHGVFNEGKISEILNYINSQQVISKTPDDLYLVTSSGLPLREVESEKKVLRETYREVTKVLNLYQSEIKELIGLDVNREIEVVIWEAALKEHDIKRRLERTFKKNYSLHVVLFIPRSNDEIVNIKDIISKLTSENEYKNVIFLVPDVILDDTTYEKFIEYKARASVADKHNYTEERNVNENYANRIVGKWVGELISGYVEWFLQGESGKELMKKISKKIQNELSQKIFTYGFENIKGAVKNRNIWLPKTSRKSIEIFLFARDRSDLERRTSRGVERYLREIIKDDNGEYIVNENLSLKEGFNFHPLKRMSLEVDSVLNKEKEKGIFNLGESLEFLTKPPYGLYSNMINMATIGFLMRKYIGKLFEAGTGIPIQEDSMKEKILSLFDYWENRKDVGKLNVRFGAEEEEELIGILKELFDFEETNSLNDVRWKIREWVKDKGFPLWSFKYTTDLNEVAKRGIDAIDDLIRSIDTELNFEKIKELKDTIERAKIDLYILLAGNPKEFFKNWLKSIEGVEFREEDVDEIISFIRRNMQEEVASWTEDKVREKVKDWEIEKLRSNRNINQELSETYDSSISVANDYFLKESKPGELKQIEEVKRKINDINDIQLLKTILYKLIEELPEIPYILEKYFGDEKVWR